MNLRARYRLNSITVAHETIDGEVVIVEFKTGSYYSLDGEGSFIWNAVAGGASIRRIIALLREAYDAPGEDIEKDVADFLAQLQKEGLIVPDGEESFAEEVLPESIPSPAPPHKSPFAAPVLKKYTDMQELLLLDPIHEVDERGWPKPKTEEPPSSGS